MVIDGGGRGEGERERESSIITSDTSEKYATIAIVQSVCLV